MQLFRDLSIRYKLTLLVLGIVSVVVLAASTANVVGGVRATRIAMARNYSMLARVVAAQSGAALSIADVDPSGAQEIIADLAADPSIQCAALVNAAGEVVASYVPDEGPAPATIPQTLGATFSSDGRLDVVENVPLNDGSTIGRIYLRAATTALQAQVRRIVLIAAAIYLIALAFGLLLSWGLQRLISAPILELAALTRRVSADHDYSVAAPGRDAKDELGELCHGFNKMLAEIRRRDEDLEQSNGELLRSNDELRQFAHVASHDLQEPLRSITSFCSVLTEECQGRLPADAEQYLDRIVGGATRMKTLVTALLGYSRVNRDEQCPFTAVDMNEVMAEVTANLQGSIDASGADVTWDDLPQMHGDRVQLVQLLQNLVGNAILYRRGTPQVHVAAVCCRGHWEFAVEDNGIGVASEHHERIFEIFKRLHGRGEYPGTGIGLAVCRKIVERHGGRIWIESTPGQGSVFRFTIHTPSPQEPTHERTHHYATAP